VADPKSGAGNPLTPTLSPKGARESEGCLPPVFSTAASSSRERDQPPVPSLRPEGEG
jgi:hypothetical protein